ncbi:unnamed protein product [Closterium sp. NIES-53]
MAGNRGWRIKQMDITTAFLNGIIQEELYMLQPEGLDDGSGRVCRLKKAIYGLKQAPRAWYHKLEETLLAGGFKKSECDHSLFLLQEKEQFLMLLVYVDDILLFSKSCAMIEHVEEMLEMQFKCSKMGDVKYYLGMHVERDLDKGVLRLHQRKYCEGLAEKYGLQDGGKPATPLPSGFTVEPCANEEVVCESDRKLFHSMVGALNYAANHTRPDIAFATSRLASVVSRPSHEQLEAAKRLVRYVSATASVGLEYSAVRQRLQRGAADLGKGEMLLTCYTDASLDSVKADGTSIGGYVCLFGGGAVSWLSKKQNEVGLSSCETEYMSLHHGAKEVVWLRRLLEEIGVCQKEPTGQGGQVAASCSCHLLSHQTLLWHHRLGHPSLPRLRNMHSRPLCSGLPRSLPPLPPSPAPRCLPCVEGRQCAAPHSSFPLMNAPLQTLHMDVWGPARVNGQSRERYFLLVVDDYTRYTTVFPLRSKGQVIDVLILWIRTVRLQLRERFGQDLPVLRLHSDRGGEFSSTLLRDFCRGEGIPQSFTLLDSPQQNSIAERRIGLVMEVARTSMIHAAAPHFLWPFAVRYSAHQLNLWPRVFTSQNVMFDESVPFYHLFPYRSAPPLPPPLFLAPGPPQVDPLPPQGPAPSGVS